MVLLPPVDQPKQTSLTAPLEWGIIEFISDLHLSALDSQNFKTFQQYLTQTPAQAVFILGDLFEAWPGDDAYADPFESACQNLFKLASEKRFIGFMQGNRDFLVGQDFLNTCNVVALHDPFLLQAFDQHYLLTHGDAWCLADQAYQAYRKQVRSAVWQRIALQIPLAERRKIAAQLRAHSNSQHEVMLDLADIDYPTALQHMQAASADTLIHGHTHRPSHDQLQPQKSRWVLSDWDLDAVEQPGHAEILRLTSQGLLRIDPRQIISNSAN